MTKCNTNLQFIGLCIAGLSPVILIIFIIDQMDIDNPTQFIVILFGGFGSMLTGMFLYSIFTGELRRKGKIK